MLFKDTIKLKEYAEFGGEINFASLKNTIRMVEEDYLIPVLGRELYTSLNAAYTAAANEASLTAAQQALLEVTRQVVGAYTLYNYIPKTDVQVTDAGVRRAETANAKTAYGYQVQNLREQKLREGERAIENLLYFLEVKKADYPQWTTSAAFLEYRKLFIKTATDFDVAFKTHSPFRNYWAMRYKMIDVEENIVKPAITTPLFVQLKAVDADPTANFSVAEKELVNRLKKAIAYFTVAYALPFLNTRVDANGITVIGWNSSVGSKDQESRIGAKDSAMSNIIESSLSSGQAWLQNAQKYITENASAFPSWSTPVVVVISDNSNGAMVGSFGLY